jgi:crossover junction endodeoxyribonuclease RuvC
MICIGIDPGLTGAMGRLNNGRFEGVLDIPTVAKGSGSVKREVDPAGVAHMLRSASQGSGEFVAVVLERVNAMPGQGVSSVFSLGDSFGSLRAVVAVLGVELHYVSPVTWKKHFKLTSDKEVSRALAVRLFPEAPLNLKKHADRAEALLMARWLHETRYA